MRNRLTTIVALMLILGVAGLVPTIDTKGMVDPVVQIIDEEAVF